MSSAVFERGRICMQLRGRRAGQKVMVIDVESPSLVVIEGVNVKRRKCNVKHLFATPKKADITKNPSKEEIVNALS
ncbi:MAG: 50S ribosomal protein L14e [Candidatus Diapherotrites archaeon]|nr:50S ribosomal protein L14e [Candidatus Diapherotrites archaeon]